MYYHTPFPLKGSLYIQYIFIDIYISNIYKNIHLARQYLLLPQSTYKQSILLLFVKTQTRFISKHKHSETGNIHIGY